MRTLDHSNRLQRYPIFVYSGVEEMGMGRQLIARKGISKIDALKLMIDKFPELNTNQFLMYSDLGIEKLVKDDYLRIDNEGYSITFEGKVFHQSGAYKAKYKKETKTATLQSWQTWAIVLGTSFAGLYGLYEMIKDISKF